MFVHLKQNHEQQMMLAIFYSITDKQTCMIWGHWWNLPTERGPLWFKKKKTNIKHECLNKRYKHNFFIQYMYLVLVCVVCRCEWLVCHHGLYFLLEGCCSMQYVNMPWIYKYFPQFFIHYLFFHLFIFCTFINSFCNRVDDKK